MMRRFHNAVRARLGDTRGFTLAEQLVSVLFLGLLCIVIAAGTNAAMGAYASITQRTNADNLLARAVESVSDELVYAMDVEGGGDFPAFTSSTMRETVQFYSPGNGSTDRGVMLATESGPSVLVPSQSGLVPVLEDLSYDEETAMWTFRVSIKSGETLLTEASLTVKRIGS